MHIFNVVARKGNYNVPTPYVDECLAKQKYNQNDSTIKLASSQWWLADVFVHLSLLTTNGVIHNINKIIE
jgi:hypothetical protein